MSTWPFVSIIFLAYNRREELTTSLEKVLHELDYPADRREVIVVDNASTDQTAERVRERFPEVTLIRNPVNVGVSGWNVGLSTSVGEWCLLLDDDCYVTGDALKKAVTAAQEDRADLVTFHVASSVQPGYRFDEEYRAGLFAFWGCSALASRRAVEELHGYDPNIFFWANELDFTMRLLDRGMRHLWLPEVVSCHMKGPTNPDKTFMLRPAQINGRHWAYIAGKALRPADAAGALLSLVWTIAYTAVFEDRTAFRAIPQILAGFARGVRHREPVRPEVSRAYRQNCRELANPLKWARRPGLTDRDEAIDAFFDARPRFYPRERAVLEL